MTAEVVEVLEANERFYRALNALDLGGMERLWSHGGFVRCVHPGWELIVGWDAVRASWEGIFHNSSGGPTHSVETADVSVHVVSDLGWVSCIERITLPGRSGGRSGGVSSSTSLAVATNLFQRSPEEGARWEMILHHASLLPLVVAEAMDSPEVIH
jgi:ketosteroid isomerase-like protein